VTSQGSAHTRFQRFVASGLLVHAETAVREMPKISLADGLAFVALLAEHDDARFPRAASRWRRRLEQERGDLDLAETQLLVAEFAALP
jgi:hypothetical protein